jgi:LPS sulfotransferase NodH
MFRRFVVMGHGRSGSTVLMLALREHPKLTAHSEVFNEESASRAWSMEDGARPYREHEDGADYLRSVVFRTPTDPTIRSVGFKIFYEHGRQWPAASTAWDYLRGERDIHVVHLIRRNLLEAWISFEVAERSGVWVQSEADARPRSVPPFRIDPDRVERFFRRIERRRIWTRRAFWGHPFLEVEYERGIYADFQGTADRIFRFLGVSPVPVQPRLAKQAFLGPHRQVLNYEELRRRFEGTAHERFFGAREVARALEVRGRA